MKKTIVVAALAALAFPAYAQAQNAGSPQGVSPATRDFIDQAAISGMFEIDSSKVILAKLKPTKKNAAAAQGNEQQVREFAQRMIHDHTQADKEMKSVLQQAKIKVKPPKKLDAQHQQMLKQLRADKGGAAVADYDNMQVQGHQQAVQLFQNYAQNGDNPQLKQFAQQTLPILQQHLQMAQQLPKSSS